MPLKGLKIGFLGGGAMGEALMTGLLRTGLVAPADIYISDISNQRLAELKQKLGVQKATDNQAVVKEADVVILAVKPHVAPSVLKEVAPVAKPGQTFISLVAGVPISLIENCRAGPVPVIRAMPNTPCLVGEGASAVSAGTHARKENVKIAMAVFNAVGKAVEIPEALLDCVTGLSGSGPAYVLLVLESLIDAGVLMGLPRHIARELVIQTMSGTVKMVRETGKHPGELKDLITSPGGTTIQGLKVLEERAVRGAIMKAVEAATLRSQELGKS